MIIAEMWLVFLLNLQFAWWSFLRSPMATYHKLRAWRDWLLAKVEYLQSESQKWKALFTTLKLPYSALRMMGVSPNMAVSMLVAGSAVGGGVVVVGGGVVVVVGVSSAPSKQIIGTEPLSSYVIIVG